MVPWLSLSILDVDKNGTIDLTELKCLLWVHQDPGTPQPSEERLRKTMAALDLDFSGAIDKIEWVSYNVGTDVGTGKIKASAGTETFYRKINDDYDANRKVMVNRLRQQITEGAVAAVQFVLDVIVDDKDKDIIMSVARGIAMDVLSELDPENRGIIQMAVVKNYQHQIDFKVKKLVDYAVEIAKVEVKESMLSHKVKLDFQDMESREDHGTEGGMAKARLKRRSTQRS